MQVVLRERSGPELLLQRVKDFKGLNFFYITFFFVQYIQEGRPSLGYLVLIILEESTYRLLGSVILKLYSIVKPYPPACSHFQQCKKITVLNFVCESSHN